jgi:excisionase family DNA binding protein
MNENQFFLSPITLEQLESRIDFRFQQSLEKFLSKQKPDTSGEKDHISFKEGCDFLGIAYPTGYAKVSKREIPYIKKGKFIYFSKKQLTEWLNSGRRKTLVELEAEAETIASKNRTKKAA